MIDDPFENVETLTWRIADLLGADPDPLTVRRVADLLYRFRLQVAVDAASDARLGECDG